MLRILKADWDGIVANIRRNPVLRASQAAGVAAIIALTALVTNYLLPPPEPPAFTASLTFNDRVAGYEGPTVRLGQNATVTYKACNNRDHDVTVGIRYLLIQTDVNPNQPQPFITQGAIKTPGCETIVYVLPVSDKVSPGTWQIAGTFHVVDKDGSHPYDFGFTTETVTVLAK